MQICLSTYVEDSPGEAWSERFAALWPAYHAWFLSAGEIARPSAAATIKSLELHMPELLPLFHDLVWRGGGSDHVARCLGLYRPAPILAGCSQAVWTRGEPMLIRNYDYNVAAWERSLVSTRWLGRQVVGMSDCLWGLLDGINENGLALSLTFGGRRIVGDGFGISLIMRYALQTCDTVAEAVEVLQRVPCHMAYNVTALDQTGALATVMIGPDRAAVVTRRRVITNHQGIVEWHARAEATGSVDRLRTLDRHLSSDVETGERFISRFLEPPTHSRQHQRGFGTLYTAVYRPQTLTASLLWPRQRIDVSMADIRPGTTDVFIDED
jgi:predicted choloylglycine hydrolase